MTKIKSFQIFIFFLCIYKVINIADCLKCYACGEPNMFLGPEYAKPYLCKDLDQSTGEDLKKFIIECPSNYLGCLTQKQGGRVMRTCDTFAFQDCQVANGVTYCYCSTDLCNIDDIKSQQSKYQSKVVPRNLVDDEDYTEMSGFGSLEEHDEQTESTQSTIIDTTSYVESTTSLPKSPRMYYTHRPILNGTETATVNQKALESSSSKFNSISSSNFLLIMLIACIRTLM